MDIFTILFAAMCILALCQPDEERFKAAFIYAFILALHDLFYANADGWLYFPSAAIFSCVTVFLLCSLSGMLARWLIVMSLIDFLGSATGFLLWVSYMPLDFYESFFKAIYAFSILLLVGGEPHAWRHFRGLHLPWVWVHGRTAISRSMGRMGEVENCETH